MMNEKMKVVILMLQVVYRAQKHKGNGLLISS